MKQMQPASSAIQETLIIPTDQTIQHFIDRLEILSSSHFPVDQVKALLKSMPFSLESLKPYIFFSDQSYTRNLIFKRPSFEILLLCWTSGQVSPIHGHEGEKCWMRVEQGELEFTNYNVKEFNGKIRIEESTKLTGPVGFVDGPAVIHKVENLTSKPAMSLHLYARPFSKCDIFDEKKQIKQKTNLRYTSISGKIVNF